MAEAPSLFQSLKRTAAKVPLRLQQRARLRSARPFPQHGEGPAVLIVGTGRCGTNSAAATLAALGVSCGHEQIYTPYGISLDRELQVESSWLAAPHLGRYTGHIVHLVRDPLETAQSFLDIGFFGEGVTRIDKPFKAYARRYFKFSGDPVTDAFRWYVEWNTMCEAHAHRRYRVDEMNDLALDIVSMLFGHPVPYELPASILVEHTNLKSGEKRRTHVASYDFIRDETLRSQVRDMASRYGFDVGRRTG